ncbi:MAG: ATP-dependent protease, partial [Bacteroidetes bacterium]|nr:ATP-dependent protease [Bacteroidota bacterium]
SIHPISWLIGRNCGLSLDQRQDLLEMRSEDKRIRVLVEYLEEFIPEVIEQWEVRMRIMSNGHFKDFPS